MDEHTAWAASMAPSSGDNAYFVACSLGLDAVLAEVIGKEFADEAEIQK